MLDPGLYPARLGRNDVDVMKILSDHICRYIRPFSPVTTTVWLDQDYRGKLYVEIKSMPGHTAIINDERLFDAMDPFFMATEVGIRAGEFFASIPRVEPEPNIALGEN